MSVEPKPIPNWTALEGTVLPGGYEIERCLSASHIEALFKLRILGDRFTEALVRVVAPSSMPAEQVQWWQEATGFRHPSISAPLAAGYASIDSAQLPYVAYVRPDETLDGVLSERALTPAEARDGVDAVLKGLAFLHNAGWVHSALAPAEILGIGEAIRLSTLRLRPIAIAPAASALPAPRYLAPESNLANITPAADFYCLGASVFEVLTRRQFTEADRERIETLPHPFADLASACLRPDPAARPSIEQARAILASPAPVRIPVTTALPAKTETAAPMLKSPAVAPRVASTGPAQSFTPPRRARIPEDADESPTAGPVWLGMAARKWLYLAAAIAVLLLVLWVFHPKPSRSAATTPTTPASSAGSQAPPSSWPSHVAQPANVATAASRNAVASAQAAGNAGVNTSWRVVVYTFMREADAEKRVNAIKAQHPALDPHIFSPKGNNGSPYLIVLGGRMTKEEAERLRRQAKASGMPRDTFIQNYSR